MAGSVLFDQVAAAFKSRPPAITGVGVSGGGDSMALLHLLHDLSIAHGTKVRAVTLNHNLRAAAAAEAEMVKETCRGLGIEHDTLLWENWDGQGNLQSLARNARYEQMAGWAHQHQISLIALGHTADDQAETVIMRLARRAGVNGLAGIPARKMREGIIWVRPLLGAGRQELRDYLRTRNVSWIDDPSNEDTRFERIRVRKALQQLELLGIDVQGLSDVASQMADARTALDWQTFLAARDIATIDAGAVVLSDRKLRLLPDEIQRRLLIHAINWISGEVYPARRGAIATVMQTVRTGQASTADGVHTRKVNGQIWIFRELNAVRDVEAPHDRLWDQRWRFTNTTSEYTGSDLSVRALGEDGLAQCPNWREQSRPRVVLLSTPALWKGDMVVAAPLAGMDQKWHAQVEGGEESFFAALLMH